jgi:putative hemolysin
MEEYIDVIKVKNLEVKIAKTPEEIRNAQHLRYLSFFEEFGVEPPEHIKKSKLDKDEFDELSDIMIVVDKNNLDNETNGVVGTYRLLRQEFAEKIGRFYTEGEFDVSKLKAQPYEIMELGRSCVHKDHRIAPVMQTLWKGIAHYILHYDIRYMFGCTSFHVNNQEEIADQLSFLYYKCLAPAEIRPKAVDGPDGVAEPIKLIPVDELDMRAALKKLPPLAKAYMRVGFNIGDGVFIDHNVKTVDICGVFDFKNAAPRYAYHYILASSNDTSA